MKSILIIFCSLAFTFLFSSKAFALNAIDSINTDKDALHFISNVLHDYKPMKSFSRYYGEAKIVADSLKVCNWTKVDMDNNGETDLMVLQPGYANGLFIIFSNHGIFSKKTINNLCKPRRIYPLVGKLDSENVLLLYYQTERFQHTSDKYIPSDLYCDTVIMKDGQFLNFIASPKEYHIEK